MENQPTRRNFIKKSSAAAAAGTVLSSTIARSAHAQGSDEIKFALIGCGGRGTGATMNIFNSGGKVKLVAVHDAFEAKASGVVNSLKSREKGKYADMVDVPAENIFSGLDGYKNLLQVDADLVIIATPPGFKPQQFEAAVNAGKHVFMEKPVASDATGVRRVLAAVEESKKKNLMVGIGLQRRHENQYKETIKRIQDGAIGDVICTRVYWNGGGIWYRNRTAEQTEMGFQCNNWYHFNWLSGDQICEQHIHNLDVGCWLKGEYPVECNGMGGRELRMNGDATKSQIFDHTFCEYTFSDGTKMYSQGRHLGGKSFKHVAEYAHGSKGTANVSGSSIDSSTGNWRFEGQRQRGHQQEQNDLIAALSRGDIYNEGEYGALSTFTAILGREACYSGRVLKWEDLLKNGTELAPGIDDYTLDTVPPTAPGADGKYPIPIPGQYDPFAKKA